MPACLYVYVRNADETWQRAVKAFAESMVKDPWGNTWQIATRM
jgi:PhnB protein